MVMSQCVLLTEWEWKVGPSEVGKGEFWEEARWEAYVGSFEKRELQQGPSTAVLQRQQEGCPWPKQLGAGLLQIIKLLTVAWHKVIIPPA